MYRYIPNYEDELPRGHWCGVVCPAACPECGADLTKVNGVELVCCVEESVLSVLTRLVPTGTTGVGVVEDVQGVVACGFECRLECSGCGHDLNWDEECVC